MEVITDQYHDQEVKEIVDENEDKLTEFCKHNHIKELSLFGSVLREEFDVESDIDVLVKFEESHIPGFFDLLRMEEELSTLLGNRDVDLRTPADLSRHFRDDVLKHAEVIYVQG